MGIGINFGSNTSKTSESSIFSKNETGTQNTSGTKNSTGTTSTSGTQTGTQSTNGTTNISQAGTNITTGQTSQQQQQTTQNFGSGVLGSLESMVQKLLGGGGSAVPSSDFNPADYVAKGMASATAKTQSGVDEALNGIFDAIGGRNNSAAALLGSRVTNDASASLAGTQANLTAQAEEIQRNNVLAGNTVAQTNNTFVAQLLDALKGGSTTTSGTATGSTAQNQQTQSTGSEGTSSTTDTSSSSSQKTTQSLVEIMAQLVNSITQTSGRTDSTGTNKKSGGGIGLSI